MGLARKLGKAIGVMKVLFLSLRKKKFLEKKILSLMMTIQGRNT
jgi:hypothetical protein